MTDKAFHLLQRHQRLDDELRAAKRKLWGDPTEIARLKKLKLAIKDRLARLSRPGKG